MKIADLEIGLQIRLARVTRRVTQRELSLRTGIAPAQISDIELGWRKPSAEEVSSIFKALGTEPEATEPKK